MTDRVLLHVGAPKTGTSFVQDISVHQPRRSLPRARHPLPRRPARRPLPRRARPDASCPGAGSRREAGGAWDRLAAEVRGWPGTAIISHEILGNASRVQVAPRAGVAGRAGGDTEVHVVVLRARPRPADPGRVAGERQAPAARRPTAEFLERPPRPRAARARWRHGSGASRRCPTSSTAGASRSRREQVHLVTVPQPGRAARPALGAVRGRPGIDPTEFAPRAHGQPSLGVPESAMVRRLNERLNDVAPQPALPAVRARVPRAPHPLARPGLPRLSLPPRTPTAGPSELSAGRGSTSWRCGGTTWSATSTTWCPQRRSRSSTPTTATRARWREVGARRARDHDAARPRGCATSRSSCTRSSTTCRGGLDAVPAAPDRTGQGTAGRDVGTNPVARAGLACLPRRCAARTRGRRSDRPARSRTRRCRPRRSPPTIGTRLPAVKAIRLPATLVIISRPRPRWPSPWSMLSSYNGRGRDRHRGARDLLLLDQRQHPLLTEQAGQDRVADALVGEVVAAQVRDRRPPSGTGSAPGPAMLAGTMTGMVTRPPMLVRKPWAPASRTWFSITSWIGACSTSPLLLVAAASRRPGRPPSQRAHATDRTVERLVDEAQSSCRARAWVHLGREGLADPLAMLMRPAYTDGRDACPARPVRIGLGCEPSSRRRTAPSGVPRPARPRRSTPLRRPGGRRRRPRAGHGAARPTAAGCSRWPSTPAARGPRMAWWSPTRRGVLPLDGLRVTPLAAPVRASTSRSGSTPPSPRSSPPAPTRTRPGGWIDEPDRGGVHRAAPAGLGALGRGLARRRARRWPVRRGHRRPVRRRVDVHPRARRLEGRADGAGRPAHRRVRRPSACSTRSGRPRTSPRWAWWRCPRGSTSHGSRSRWPAAYPCPGLRWLTSRR